MAVLRSVFAIGGFAALFAPPGLAQVAEGPGWRTSVDGLYVYQGEADLSSGGSFSGSRSFLRGSALYSTGHGVSAGISVSYGRYVYEFGADSADPWDDITDMRLSVPIRVETGDRTNLFVVPSLRYDYESGADAHDGQTWGVFAGLTWTLSDALTIGPAFGAFTEIESDDLNLFPALLIDWDISDRWSLSTANAPGATQGPGVSLQYQASDALRLGLTARYENLRFRLDDDGPAPGGVGEDQSLPVALSLQYSPNPGTSLSAFVGAEFNGRLTLEDSGGNRLSRQDYDTAPIAGLSFRLAF